ncbi:GNAT family N-acetyltransferase [Bacterioplanes sanyensis]|uniref:GNAT family N-acetyltransferase n=1 Tax=Bacterioplanes sanyensis TaxID=1249553 RepID=A0A222FKG0_9GAMM|nr:GNAT family N-acetyltransferase [Bacterioplanes sanyensis]ASP38861.1 GNAT family N-acetyltransferase [Bacterioplanes sanyensis]
MLQQEVLIGERIELRPPEEQWLDDLWAAVESSRAELGQFLDWVPLITSRSAVADNLAIAIDNFVQDKNERRYFIYCQNTQQFLGLIGLHIRDPSVPFYEIGYWLITSAYGRGFMTEAVNLLSDYALQHRQAKRVEIRTAASNASSIRVAERCGYEQEALLKNHRRLPNGQLDHTVIFCRYGE